MITTWRGVEARSGVGRLGRRRVLGRTGKPCAALTYVPADEVPDHLGPLALSDKRTEGSPQLVLDPDGSVLGVGVLHEVKRNPCICRCDRREVAVYIHRRYLRVYPRQEQVAWQIKLSARETGGLFSMLKNGDLSMARTLPAHATCNHKNYMLSCEIYEQMLAETGQRCEVCERLAEDNPGGKLYIDHDSHVGYWAVRGLLCNPCNTRLRRDAALPADEAFARYLENAWYRREMAARGFTAGALAEPPDGGCVRDHRGNLWRRRRGHWSCSDARYKARNWLHLVSKSGPLGLTWVQPDEVPIHPAAPEAIAVTLRAFMSPEDLNTLVRLIGENNQRQQTTE